MFSRRDLERLVRRNVRRARERGADGAACDALQEQARDHGARLGHALAGLTPRRWMH